ncbi:oxygen-independent coproporphyrinogen III oxidase [Novosphingobium sp. JCM 18896]|uniref:oxygen-independent coproporphyrinogen III oxidase n=1 Tax=Novosphingobium sp. JCM 18896 TaxID=2989731 RepID=UPI002222CC90|nr:oxygen-independent coproporphyrinogen III oxidase [Novosphingobium sp. JCM 18896]MCW1428976.1 oxygen-independent coproporphyrinogen III oxidase [Novosphingobium sp. JCM 18896]
MWPYHPDLLSTPVPRYTSYPTAAEFGTGIDEVDLEAALVTATGDVSLYLHVPFCEAICWYCGCNTGRANKRQRLASYLDALHREIALVGSRLPPGARVRRIAFGGGSPNAIQPTDFVRLILALTQAFPLADPEISVELDPRTLDRDWTQVLGRVGVTRASLGVQTFDAAAQVAIGRIQPTHLIERCTALLREAGVTSLNYDLMYGLPGQDRDALKASLALTHMLGADRVALFGYAHVPHLIPRQQKIDAAALPGQAERFAMAEFGHDWLAGAGYVPVGFDHFARPEDPLARAARAGHLRRNFQGFTDDQAPILIGLGASAISAFPGLLVQNQKNAGRYRMLLSQDRLPVERGLRRSDEDRRRGAVIAALLCQGRARLDAQLLHESERDLDRFVRAGLAAIRDGELVIAPAGLPYARTIAALFDPYRRQDARRFSSAV